SGSWEQRQIDRGPALPGGDRAGAAGLRTGPEAAQAIARAGFADQRSPLQSGVALSEARPRRGCGALLPAGALFASPVSAGSGESRPRPIEFGKARRGTGRVAGSDPRQRGARGTVFGVRSTRTKSEYLERIGRWLPTD